jgi:hypothetical protein
MILLYCLFVLLGSLGLNAPLMNFALNVNYNVDALSLSLSLSLTHTHTHKETCLTLYNGDDEN